MGGYKKYDSVESQKNKKKDFPDTYQLTVEKHDYTDNANCIANKESSKSLTGKHLSVKTALKDFDPNKADHLCTKNIEAKYEKVVSGTSLSRNLKNALKETKKIKSRVVEEKSHSKAMTTPLKPDKHVDQSLYSYFDSDIARPSRHIVR